MKLSTLNIAGVALLAAAVLTPAARAAAGPVTQQAPAAQPVTASRILPRLVPVTLAAYATVEDNGTLVTAQSKNVTAVTANLQGGYRITTALASVARCSFSVSSGVHGNTAIPRAIFAGATGLAGTTNGVYVQTYSNSGAATPESFMLQIFC